MSIDVTTHIVINCPVQQVSAYAADPGNAPAWYKNIKSVEWVTPRRIEVGARVAFVAEFLRRRLVYTYEIVEFIAGRRLVMQTADGPFPMETTYTWEATADDRTKMTLRNRGVPAGFSRWIAPFMAVAVRRANKQDLVLLKKRLESGSHSLRTGPQPTR